MRLNLSPPARALVVLLPLLKVACNGGGSDDAAAPTADEIRAAQVGSQAAGDSGFGPSPRQVSTSRATSAARATGGRLGLTRASASDEVEGFLACLGAALNAGKNLSTEASAQLEADLFGNVTASIALTLEAGAGGIAAAGGTDTSLQNSGAIATSITSGLSMTRLVFPAADCTFDGAVLTGNEVTRSDSHLQSQTVADLSWALADGDVLRVTSLDPTRPTYEQALVVDANIFTATIFLNEHRRITSANGSVKLDIASKTTDTAGLTVVGRLSTLAEIAAESAAATASPSSRTITQGAVVTTHQLAKFEATQTFNSLQLDTSQACGCPVAGSFTQSVVADDKSRTATHTYTFTACGRADVKSTVKGEAGAITGESQVAFENCGS